MVGAVLLVAVIAGLITISDRVLITELGGTIKDVRSFLNKRPQTKTGFEAGLPRAHNSLRIWKRYFFIICFAGAALQIFVFWHDGIESYLSGKLALIQYALLAAVAIALATANPLKKRLADVSIKEAGLPVLYLRAFDDDVLNNSALRRREIIFSLEDVVTRTLEGRGPVIAVSDPRLSGGGRAVAAQRVPLTDDWQQSVLEMMTKAPAVVMVVGNTVGVSWEIDRLIERHFVDKTIFIIPPLDRDEAVRRIRILQEKLGIDGESTPFRDETIVVARAMNRGVTVAARGRQNVAYEHAITIALYVLAGGAANEEPASNPDRSS